MHQNLNKPNKRAAKTDYGSIFLPFYVIIISFSYFSYQEANITGSNYAIIGCNLSKKPKLAMYQIRSGEPSYFDHKIGFFFNILLEANCVTITWA